MMTSRASCATRSGVILNRRDDSTERLLELAEKYRGSKADDGANAQQAEWRTRSENASNIRW